MASIVSPSFTVRSVVQGLLSSATLGFNANYAASLANYPGALPISIDFAAAKPMSFFLGRLAIEDIVESGAFKFPVMSLYTTAGANQNMQKFQKFAGLVRVGVDVHLSYKTSQARIVFEAWPDAVEDAMYTTFNQAAAQNWGSGVVYNGQLGFERRQVRRGAENWLQTLYFQATFEAIIT